MHIPELDEKVHVITLLLSITKHYKFKYVLDGCLIDGESIAQEIKDGEGVDIRHLMRLRSHGGDAEELVADIAASRYIPSRFFTAAYILNEKSLEKPALEEFFAPRDLYV